jgi:hypothetical protein
MARLQNIRYGIHEGNGTRIAYYVMAAVNVS